MWKNRLTYPHCLWIKIHLLPPAFVDIVESVDNFSTKNVDNFFCQGSLWKVWITFPQCVWKSDDGQYMPIWLWKVWITFPQCVWISRFHRSFTQGDVDNSLRRAVERENALPGTGDEEGADADENGLVVSWLMELSTKIVDNSMKKCAEVITVYTETA